MLAAPKFEEIGAGVSLGPNASRALRLIHPALDDALQRQATNNLSADKQQVWFTCRLGHDMNARAIFDVPCETGQLSVHRAEFLDEMVALVPDEIAHFGKRLVDVEEMSEQVILQFADGSSATHRALIACDGIKSRGRQLLLGNDHPAAHAVFSGKYAYRGLVDMEKAKSELGEELASNAQLYTGRGGHVLHFPTGKGKMLNIVAFATRDQWTEDSWIVPGDFNEMMNDFEGWGSVTRKVVALISKPDIWALFDHPPAPQCYRGRFCLLGDALHASTPHQGAGASQAIEDALVMSKVIGGVDLKDSDAVSGAFALFGQYRTERALKLVRTSREAGLLYDMQLPGVLEDVEKLKENLSTRMSWIWDYDLKGLLARIERQSADQ